MTFPAKWSATAYLLIVFMSGVVVGGFAYRLYSVKAVVSSTERPRMTPQEYRKKAVREMTDRLHLTPEQVQGLAPYVDGVVVGSAIVQRVAKLKGPELIKEVGDFIAALKAPLRKK